VEILFRTRNFTYYTWLDNKVREPIALKMLHNSLLNTTVVAFKVLTLGSYASMSASSPLFKKILEMILWNGLQSCRYITPDDISVIKMPSFQYFLYLREQKTLLWVRSDEYARCSNIFICLIAKYSLTDSTV